MPVEKRTRVEIFLPIRSDLADYQAITDWLAEELAYARGGSTLTTPFTGLYVPTSQAGVIRDSIQVLFCDFDLNADNEHHHIELTVWITIIPSHESSHPKSSAPLSPRRRGRRVNAAATPARGVTS